ncbi:MAG: hypothetical protein QME71_03620 [Dehalococcoidia bacterium]|nr:hypothetical protein [Dehalococcoidia bacterium]
MPTRDEYKQVALRVLRPHVASPATAWRGVYQLLLWFQDGLPHIIEADQLLRPKWTSRAAAVRDALAQEFGCAPDKVVEEVDLLLKSEIFTRAPQRQNPLGIGFVTSLLLLLEHFSSRHYAYFTEEAIGEVVFRGIREAPRSKPDIVVGHKGSEIALISAKWSLRHDRLKDLKDECAYFKTLVPRLKFYVVTNEFSPARLDKVISDYRIDRVFHVCRRLVVDVAQVDGRTDQLSDLSDLLELFAA